MSELLTVAKIGKTIGLRGALKLHNKSDFISQFKKNAKFFLSDGTMLEILSYNSTSSQVIFKDYESIELASNLVNKFLYQSIEATRKNCKLKKDEYFYFDIIGLEVVENGETLGKVVDILEVGANFLFEIKTDEKLVSQGFTKNFFVPYIDEYLDKISIQTKQIFTKNAKLILKESWNLTL